MPVSCHLYIHVAVTDPYSALSIRNRLRRSVLHFNAMSFVHFEDVEQCRFLSVYFVFACCCQASRCSFGVYVGVLFLLCSVLEQVVCLLEGYCCKGCNIGIRTDGFPSDCGLYGVQLLSGSRGIEFFFFQHSAPTTKSHPGIIVCEFPYRQILLYLPFNPSFLYQYRFHHSPSSTPLHDGCVSC